MAVDGLLQGIDTIIIRVRDYEASANWYTAKLGLPVVFQDPASRLVVLDTSGPTSLTIWQADGPINPGRDSGSYPIFRTPDARALRLKLLDRGVEAGEITSDSQVTFFPFFDPDGNMLEACQVHD
jgi:catechol 2,3-dioxygenase-like lactoylglutathione lyase family enzyme